MEAQSIKQEWLAIVILIKGQFLLLQIGASRHSTELTFIQSFFFTGMVVNQSKFIFHKTNFHPTLVLLSYCE